MTRFRPHPLLLSLLALADPASARTVAITGKPLTPQPDLVLNNLVPMLAITSGCRDRPERVDVQLFSKSDDLSANPEGTALVRGWVQEAWTFSACGRQIPMAVTYQFQPDGRTRYVFAGEKGLRQP